MHSLSKELLSTKVLHLRDAKIMDKKVLKLLRLPKQELVQVAIEVRTELDQPSITDVLLDESSTPLEICSDIMHAIKNSVKTNFATIIRR